jgi:hypothetical protein
MFFELLSGIVCEPGNLKPVNGFEKADKINSPAVTPVHVKRRVLREIVIGAVGDCTLASNFKKRTIFHSIIITIHTARNIFLIMCVRFLKNAR